MQDAVAVGVGAVLGAAARYQAGRAAAEWILQDAARSRRSHEGWHTAAINVGGSFLLGVVTAAPTAAAAAAESPAPSRAPKTPPLGLTPRSKLLLGVGFCGSFTTFSTYSVDVVKWLQQGQTARALSYVAVNNVGGVVAAAAGMVLAQKLFG